MEPTMTPEESAKMAQMESDLAAKEGILGEKEDELFSEASPKGAFTSKALNALVQAVNRALPLFGESQPYEKFEIGTLTSLPPDFVRILSMLDKAIADAIEQGVLPESAQLNLPSVTDDQDIMSLAGRINMAAQNPAFKRMLKGGVKTKVEVEVEAPSPEGMGDDMMSEDATSNLFSSRM